MAQSLKPFGVVGKFDGVNQPSLIRWFKKNLKVTVYDTKAMQKYSDWKMLVVGDNAPLKYIQAARDSGIPIVDKSWIKEVKAAKNWVEIQKFRVGEETSQNTSSKNERPNKSPSPRVIRPYDNPLTRNIEAAHDQMKRLNESLGRSGSKEKQQNNSPESSRLKEKRRDNAPEGSSSKEKQREGSSSKEKQQKKKDSLKDSTLKEKQRGKSDQRPKSSQKKAREQRVSKRSKSKTIEDSVVLETIESLYPTERVKWLKKIKNPKHWIVRVPVHPDDVRKPDEQQRTNYPMVIDFAIHYFLVVHDPLNKPSKLLKASYLLSTKECGITKTSYLTKGGHILAKSDTKELKRQKMKANWWGCAYNGRICYVFGALKNDKKPTVWTRTDLKSTASGVDDTIDDMRKWLGQPPLSGVKARRDKVSMKFQREIAMEFNPQESRQSSVGYDRDNTPRRKSKGKEPVRQEDSDDESAQSASSSEESIQLDSSDEESIQLASSDEQSIQSISSDNESELSTSDDDEELDQAEQSRLKPMKKKQREPVRQRDSEEFTDGGTESERDDTSMLYNDRWD